MSWVERDGEWELEIAAGVNPATPVYGVNPDQNWNDDDDDCDDSAKDPLQAWKLALLILCGKFKVLSGVC